MLDFTVNGFIDECRVASDWRIETVTDCDVGFAQLWTELRSIANMDKEADQISIWIMNIQS